MTNSIIIPEDHFRPLVFVDMAVSAKIACIGIATVGKSAEKEFNDGKHKFSAAILSGYEKVHLSSKSVTNLIKSIEDITI